ncbi:MAG: hypothetical protein AAGB31_07735 [Bdellovibrio sp.]
MKKTFLLSMMFVTLIAVLPVAHVALAQEDEVTKRPLLTTTDPEDRKSARDPKSSEAGVAALGASNCPECLTHVSQVGMTGSTAAPRATGGSDSTNTEGKASSGDR